MTTADAWDGDHEAFLAHRGRVALEVLQAVVADGAVSYEGSGRRSITVETYEPLELTEEQGDLVWALHDEAVGG